VHVVMIAYCLRSWQCSWNFITAEPQLAAMGMPA